MSKLGPRDHCREAAASSNLPDNYYLKMVRIIISYEEDHDDDDVRPALLISLIIIFWCSVPNIIG